MTLYIGGVVTWDTGLTPRRQARKVLEEAGEVADQCAVWQAAEHFGAYPGDVAAERRALVDECCDAITAIGNLLAGIGVTDIREAMERCAERQRERGRL